MTTDQQSIQDLTEQNAALENYFRNTIIPQLFVDRNFILRKFTPPAMKQFNLTPADIGRSLHDISDNFRYPTMPDNVRQVIESHQIFESEIQTTDGSWFQMNILPYVQKEDNKINGVIITFVDITARIKVLKEHEKLISDHETLLDTIGHDMKSPLNNLMLIIEQFKSADPADKEDFNLLLEMAERAVTKITYLVNELSASREQEYKHKSNDELLVFDDIIEDVRLTLSEDIRASGAVIKRDLQVSEIMFSRRKLRSILFNLLNNAIKYRSAERTPEVFIKTANTDEGILVSVTDNGIGIDKSNHDAIFAKYYRVDKALEGTGIGLYLVKQLVTNAGGKIFVDSGLDKGTAITIFFKRP